MLFLIFEACRGENAAALSTPFPHEACMAGGGRESTHGGGNYRHPRQKCMQMNTGVPLLDREGRWAGEEVGHCMCLSRVSSLFREEVVLKWRRASQKKKVKS